MSNFICLSGDCDNFALTKAGCFAIQDDHGRDWICYESKNVRSDAHKAALALKEMQKRSYLLGLERDGTNFLVATAVDPEALPACLAKV